MGAPVLFAENFYNPIIFPLHVLSATEEAAGHEVFHIADGRRSSFDYWSGTTANALENVIVHCDVARTPNCLALDRGFNFAGQTVKIDQSDNGSSWTNAFSATIPTSVTSNRSIDNANGCLTEEGAWLWRFGTGGGSHAWWRFQIPGILSTISRIVGLWLGTAYVPPAGVFYVPWDEDQNDLLTEETTSPYGWSGRGPITTIRRGSVSIRMDTVANYDTSGARYHVQQLFGKGRPSWICYDDAFAERSFLAIRPANDHLSIGYNQRFPRDGSIAYREHEPLVS